MIQFESVCKSWDGGRTFAVRDLTLAVEDGTVLALLGGSGCGKSTTIKMVNRLTDISSGRIVVNGQDVTEQDPVTLRRSMGYVFQAIGLFPHLTIAENVDIVSKISGDRDRAARNQRVARLLRLVELDPDEFSDRYPTQLSGGQRQRVGFARALATDPQVMLLDEPFGALDPVTRDSLQTEFLQLQRRLGFTAILVTHDMAEALVLADRIAVMNEGRMLRAGTPRELLRDPGHPYVSSLIDTPRRHGELIHELMVTSPCEGRSETDASRPLERTDEKAEGNEDA